MKKIKRFAVVLLVCGLLLSTLTACGMLTGKKLSDAVMEEVNTERPADEQLRNNWKLQMDLMRMLNDIDSDGYILAKDAVKTEVTGATTTHWQVFTVTPEEDDAEELEAMDFADTEKQELLPLLAKQIVSRYDTSAVAIAYKSVGSHLYVGFAYTENGPAQEPVVPDAGTKR